jgi:hypothetical protein
VARELHPAVREVHHAARSVLRHGDVKTHASLWQRLFPPKGQMLYDKLRQFGHALKHLLDVPPSVLTAEDLAAIAADVDGVAQRAEQEIERDDRSSGEPLESYPAAIYTIRERYERIYQRGAS